MAEKGRHGGALALSNENLRRGEAHPLNVSVPKISLAHMKQDRLNICLILHCHKCVTDTSNIADISKKFVNANEQRKRNFGNTSRGMRLA